MKRYSWIFGGLLLLASCTGDFKDINTDLSGVTDEDLQIDYNEHGIRLGIIQQGIYFNYDYGKGKNWPFQLTQNLNADMFSGYMHDGKPLEEVIIRTIICRMVGIVLCGDILIRIFFRRYTSRKMQLVTSIPAFSE